MKTFCLLLWLMAFVPLKSMGTETYTVGSQNINYFPHYQFESATDKGFAWALLEAFAQCQDVTFRYQSFPIKRLQRELHKGTIDFVYPDNPRWHNNSPEEVHKIYSQAFLVATSGTIITKNKLGRGLKTFRSLAVPFGFTPVKWQQLEHFEKVRQVLTPDAVSALRMVLLNRVDGADVEYNVMLYARVSIDPENLLVMDKTLPYTEVEFQLSSITHKNLIRRLDQFIAQNDELIAALRTRYNIKLPAQVNAAQNN